MTSYLETTKLKECARWLSFCLSIGWDKSKLDALERLWWEYHDDMAAPESRKA